MKGHEFFTASVPPTIRFCSSMLSALKGPAPHEALASACGLADVELVAFVMSGLHG